VKCVNKKNTHPATWNGTAELEGLPAYFNIRVTQDNQLSITHNNIATTYLITFCHGSLAISRNLFTLNFILSSLCLFIVTPIALRLTRCIQCQFFCLPPDKKVHPLSAVCDRFFNVRGLEL